MLRIDGFVQHYAWGSTDVLPQFLSRPADGQPWAEIWFGAHPLAPSTIADGARGLDAVIAAAPRRMLGDSVMRAFGPALPFLLKLIAPAQPLSLQVHPSKEHAQESFAAENAAGIPLDSHGRNYRDANHKPEMLMALTPFEALCGFRTPRKALSIVRGLDTPLSEQLTQLITEHPSAHGMRAAFRRLVTPALSPSAEEVGALAEACRRRLDSGESPSPRIDATVATLQSVHPGDPGVAAALLMNPVSLQPGEAMFVPDGIIHSYQSGLGIEIMASSDNVLRAGLTSKKVDANELLQCASVAAAPPIRIGPEKLTENTAAYFSPIDDFELSITTLPDGASFYPSIRVPGQGPRILLCIDGDVLLQSASGRARVRPGDAVFVSADDGAVAVGGHGRIVQASVP
ncbi:mannose-6-phosphate isomerase, class I [Helcobacillus sp. ACRRO]|uniref:mannose-6-phosphate isomerase, class I n=1 Tax=Helcobacillus TaxID=1161125 RepID=UPI001EF68A2C|nr:MULTISPECIES: mannose-6-phosphate isomerase, class I [Helcobacillus]MCG7427167.1 mannose-6-phosphate isomerase, class I [Helcobacillus sp. ACRRO]MDK7741887.1 mannose-6-phosphate isomerase, class I [Helcobacillus massiliensis]WOO92922.1 mannose-6-phosphate isomerase, class I [Helcobacillus massiliensis]